MIERFARWLKEQDNVVFLGHVSPDGDCAGSNMALCMAMRAMGKNAWAHLPGGLAKMYAFLPGADIFTDDLAALNGKIGCAVAVDVSDPARLGDGREVFESCPVTAVVDHHGTNPGFGQLNLVMPECAAAGEIVLQIIEAMGVTVTPEIAQWLYCAVITDSGNFNFSNTTQQTLTLAGKLVGYGVDVDAITAKIYRTRTFARTKLLGLVLADFSLELGGKAAIGAITQDMLRAAGATWADNEGLVNYLLEVEGVQAAVLAQQMDENTIKLSLRSRPPFDIAACVAVPLGGGGHKNAAGATVKGSVQKAHSTVLALLEKAL